MTVKNISLEELERLLKNSRITTNERFLIDSFVYQPLIDYCQDIKFNEVERVHILEEKNIFRYLNVSCIILGVYGKEALEMALSTPPLSDALHELKQQYIGKELEKNTIILMVKLLLALGNRDNQIATPVFEGEMPQKFMSFRNQTAKEWFNNFVDTKLFVLANLYEKVSWEEAKAHLFASIAYQLHHSNPAKYNINANVSINDGLMNIMKKFINEQGGNPSVIYSNSGEVLSKVL